MRVPALERRFAPLGTAERVDPPEQLRDLALEIDSLRAQRRQLRRDRVLAGPGTRLTARSCDELRGADGAKVGAALKHARQVGEHVAIQWHDRVPP